MITFEDLTLEYKGTLALRDVSLSIARGKTTALIGPSGCGKSSLVKLAMGLVAPTRGSVRFDGTPIERDVLPSVRRRTGYVIQSGGLFPHLTARENVTLCARHSGRKTSWTEARVHDLARLVQLPQELLARRPHQLSGGQRQRVSLMRALMLDPEVLLLDEPLGALDPIVRHDLQRELRAVFESLAKTVVVVTHDLAEAAYFAHSIVLMREGRVLQQGTLGDLQRQPADPFVAVFLEAQQPLPPRDA